MTTQTTYGARALQALAAALTIIAVCLFAAAPRASADPTAPHCNYDGRTFNACLSFQYGDYFSTWNAAVGIDVYLPEQYGREIVACGANFQASLWSDDGGHEHFLRNLVIAPGWPIAQTSGISAQLYAQGIYSTQLDEDDDGADEWLAHVSFWDCHTDMTRTFKTAILQANF